MGYKNLLPSTVGFDRLLSTIDDFDSLFTEGRKAASYPPYNIIKNDEANYEIEVALAGFRPEEIEVSTEQSILRVTSKCEKRDSERTYLHKGLSKRSFNHSWQLSEDVRVSSVDFADGLLTISLEKIIPEHQKRTTYTIGAGKQELLTEG